ncbi:MAG: hypothetical protein JW938_02400 [Candidatus Omnitrophica bacterium]|nr:hypothetical protein [Candidatus Omnitrophota bacterium]
MKRIIVLIVVCTFVLSPLAFAAKGEKGASEAALENASDQAVFNRVGDWFATIGKSPEEKEAKLAELKAARAQKKADKEAAKAKKQAEKEAKKAEKEAKAAMDKASQDAAAAGEGAKKGFGKFMDKMKLKK